MGYSTIVGVVEILKIVDVQDIYLENMCYHLFHIQVSSPFDFAKLHLFPVTSKTNTQGTCNLCRILDLILICYLTALYYNK